MNNKKITVGTISRTVILAIALINQLLTAMGHNVINISDDSINTLISTAFTVVSAVVAWWKNNSFTAEACLGDEVMSSEKECRKKKMSAAVSNAGEEITENEITENKINENKIEK